ncbi:MAG: glutamate synthase-related protein [Methanobacterium sp.]
MEDSAEIRRKIEDSKENRNKCACPYCPSYPHDCNGDVLYCANGKSRCDIEPEGCICNTCPVYFEYELNGLYYCNKDELGHDKISMRKKGSNEDDSFYQDIVNIKEMAATGSSTVSSMGSLKKLPFSLNDLHFIPAQVQKIPLNSDEDVNTEVKIGPESKKPFKVTSPLMISGMSFGAVSKNVRLVIAKTAQKLKIAFNSGEGGILPEEIEIAGNQMIVQYSTGRYGINEEILKSASAVEIRFGQGAYPGKGSFLPAEKITREIAEIRGIEKGEPSYSPASHYDMRNPEDIKNKVNELRKITGGAPIGAKIGCGNVEKDLEILLNSKVDFIALDGFGGATGATDLYVRENVGIPITAALPRAHRYLDELGVRDKVTLIASGRLLSSADFAKCLALGADAVYLGTAALIAIGCEQYRICYTGMCPTGITTQNPQLMKQLNVDDGVRKLTNFINISNKEIANLARIVGKNDVNLLDKDDLVSMNKLSSSITGVRWVNGR